MPIISNQPNFLLENIEFSEDAQYYLSTKVQSEYFSGRFSEKVFKWQNNPLAVSQSYSTYKVYWDKPRIDLKPNLKKFKNLNWEKVVLNRKSSRDFVQRPISYTQLCNLLVMSCGAKENGNWLKKIKNKTHWPRRALPSGGAMYSLEYYILALNVTGLKPGLYHFNIFQGGLSLLRTDQEIFDLDKFWAQRNLFKNPSAIIFVTSIFNKVRVKYGARALRYILLEAGGVGTQMNLLSEAMNLDFCFDGGGYENKIEELIGIDGYREGLITTFVVGHTNSYS